MNVRRCFTDRRSRLLLASTVVLTVACVWIVHHGVRATDQLARDAAPKDLPSRREPSIVRVEAHYKLEKTSWGPVEPPEAHEEEPVDEAQAEQGKHFQGIDLADVHVPGSKKKTHR